MIVFDLTCDKNHVFEAWFKDSATFDRQSKKRLVTCAVRGSTHVRKAPMAPRISSGSAAPAPAERGPDRGCGTRGQAARRWRPTRWPPRRPSSRPSCASCAARSKRIPNMWGRASPRRRGRSHLRRSGEAQHLRRGERGRCARAGRGRRGVRPRALAAAHRQPGLSEEFQGDIGAGAEDQNDSPRERRSEATRGSLSSSPGCAG